VKQKDRGENRSNRFPAAGPEIAGSFPLHPARAILESRKRAVHCFVTGRSVCLRREGDKKMPLLQILMVLIVVGVLLWLVNSFIPMQGTIKSLLNAVVVIATVLWLLNIFGLFHSLSHIRVGA
jgi:hypothetical protein